MREEAEQHAIVQLPDDACRVAPEELLEHLRGRLVPYKVPRTVEFSTEPLRDDAGKSRRGALRAERLSGLEGLREVRDDVRSRPEGRRGRAG